MLPAKALSLISSYLTPTTPPAVKQAQPSQQSTGATSKDRILAIVFSKDRPGQLLWCVESLLKHVRRGYDSSSAAGVDEIRVIYLAADELCEAKYAESFSRLSRGDAVNNIKFIKQNSTSAFFYDLVLQSLEDGSFDYIYFQVDDAIYYDYWDSGQASRLLKARPDVFGVHSKLWVKCTRCQPANDAMMTLPQFTEILYDHRLFHRSQATHDWNYVFDLSGGLYRRRDVLQIVKAIDAQKCSTPNRLEVLGNESSWLKSIDAPISACPDRDNPCLSLVTINRVQDDYENPLYQCSALRNDQSKPYGYLTNLLFSSSIDIDRYKSQSTSYDACHVGDLFVLSKSRHGSIVDVSVLIPCRNAEATLARAVLSVMEQDIGEYKMEIIVIDDASDDASAFIAQSFISNSKTVQVRAILRKKSVGGLKRCLDFGIAFCRASIICRMDADDVCLPGRIKAQLEAMIERPSLGVVGTLTTIHNCKDGFIRSAPTPVGKCSVAWSMFFYCSLVHPSVCYRKMAVSSVGGYEACVEKAYAMDGKMEDYVLWHEIIAQRQWDLDNLAIIGLVHYKHPSSVTAAWNKESAQLEQATISLKHARTRSLSLGNVSFQTWCSACFPKQGANLLLSSEEKHHLKAGLTELKESLIEEYKQLTTKYDLEFVEKDYLARMVEVELF